MWITFTCYKLSYVIFSFKRSIGKVCHSIYAMIPAVGAMSRSRQLRVS